MNDTNEIKSVANQQIDMKALMVFMYWDLICMIGAAYFIMCATMPEDVTEMGLPVLIDNMAVNIVLFFAAAAFGAVPLIRFLMKQKQNKA